MELDLEPFKAHFPMMTRPSSIGDGVRFLNRRGSVAAQSSLGTHMFTPYVPLWLVSSADALMQSGSDTGTDRRITN